MALKVQEFPVGGGSGVTDGGVGEANAPPWQLGCGPLFKNGPL